MSEEHPSDAVPLTAEEGPADAAPLMAEQHPVDAAIITTLHDDLLERILISLPGAAFLARAVPVSDRWCRIISNESFLKRFRVSHPSSPLIGVFVDNKNERVPRFHTGIATSNPVIASAVRHTDICLTRLDDGLRWRLQDCRNGQLLLSGAGGLLCIYDPLSERRVPIGPRTHLDHDGKCLGDCLLDGLARHMVSVEQHGQQMQAEESFRVISLQWQSSSRFNVRAIEYNSGTLEWRVHPQTGWTKVQLTKLQLKAMYAAGHIFWQTDVARLLVLDTSTMEFSEDAVPWEIVSTSWAIGELRDGKGCLVCLQGLNSSFVKDGFIVEEPLRLEVWALKKEEEDKQARICWKCEKDVRVSEILPEDARVYKVQKVINGLALIGCTKGSYAIDLQSMTLLAKFESGGDVYPYQMSWPPAVLAAATSVVSRHLGANLSNQESAQISSNNMDGREGTSSGGSESASLQSQLQVESPDVSGSSGIEDASRDDDNQHVLASLGIGDAAHTDATIVPAINAVNSHANEEETGGWASDGRTMLTTTHEKVAQDIAPVSPEGEECESRSGSRKKSNESGMHLEESCNPGFKLNGHDHEAGNLHRYQNLPGNDRRPIKTFQYAFQYDTVLQSESARFPEIETKGSTSSVETLLDNMLNSKDKDGSHLIKGIQTKHVSTEVHSSQTPLNSEQHGIGEKSSQDLHGGSARIQPMETDPCHDELTLQTAGVFPSESCDGIILEEKSETDNLPNNTTEDTEMLEQQNSDKAHTEVSCVDKMSEVLYDDNNTLEKNTIFGGKVTVECHLALLHNKNSEARSNTISSPMQKRHFREVHEQKKHFTCGFTGCSEEFSSKHRKKIHEVSSAHVELSTNRIKCVSTSPAGGPEAHEETRPAQVVARRTSNRPRKPNKLVSGDDWVF